MLLADSTHQTFCFQTVEPRGRSLIQKGASVALNLDILMIMFV